MRWGVYTSVGEYIGQVIKEDNAYHAYIFVGSYDTQSKKRIEQSDTITLFTLPEMKGYIKKYYAGKLIK